MNGETLQRVATLPPTIVGLLTIMVGPAAATHDSLECTPPESLTPLIELLHTVTELVFVAGIVLGVIGFSSAGLLLMLPGQDNSRRGMKLAKNVLIGIIILLSAEMVVGFLVNELGGVICS